MLLDSAYNIAVVDDKRTDSEKLQRGIHRWFTENHDTPRSISCFPDGESLLNVFEPYKFHIIFLDIIMDRLSGIDTAQRLRISDSRTLLVFTTSSDEFAFDAFPLHAFDYVIKPFTQERIARVMNEAAKVLEAPEAIFTARVSRSTYYIPLRKISAALAHDHFVEIVMLHGNSMLCSMKFGEAEEILMKDARFLSCTRGVIINMDCVSSLSRDKSSVIMNDGSHYPIKSRGRSEIISAFVQYQISRMKRGM
ncbi:MAG: response regulator transcription factor [Synergistaceae bacterium]|nr:response regulator transcription factor [Synergistaceae bacterium]MBQ4432122.1 response regulator transcription factor [Synergistaceae bacterium]MBQ7168943.1 response regulator transcription factor [Synergistaceae bacterium]